MGEVSEVLLAAGTSSAASALSSAITKYCVSPSVEMAEEFRKSPSVVVRIGSFLALSVTGQMAMPVMVSDLVLAVVLGEIVVEEL